VVAARFGHEAGYLELPGQRLERLDVTPDVLGAAELVEVAPAGGGGFRSFRPVHRGELRIAGRGVVTVAGVADVAAGEALLIGPRLIPPQQPAPDSGDAGADAERLEDLAAREQGRGGSGGAFGKVPGPGHEGSLSSAG